MHAQNGGIQLWLHFYLIYFKTVYPDIKQMHLLPYFLRKPLPTSPPFQPASFHCSSHFELKILKHRFEGTLMVSHVTGLFSVMLITPPASSSRTGLTFTSRSCNYKAHICRWTLITLAIHSSCSDSSLQRRGSCAGPEETGRWRYLVNYRPLLIMP